jgi:sorbitol/mannitol transport system substrate-binding protein
MIKRLAFVLLALLFAAASASAQQKTVIIAVVNSPDILRLEKLSSKFEEQNPNINLTWVVVEEKTLRQRVLTDVSQGGGQFDVVYMSLYDVPIFAKHGWLKPLENIPADYDIEDVFKSIRDGFSYEEELYALPFYGESSMLIYRKDLFAAKGLKMPNQPTYDDVKNFADALTDRSKGINGIILWGKPGWNENMTYIGTLINTFGATWYDENWKATFKTPEWKKALTFYFGLMKTDGPAEASKNGFNENLALFASGKAAIWIDATSAGRPLCDESQSQVSDKVAFAKAPIAVTPNGSHWLWSWAFAIPRGARSADAAEKFALWATSKEYIKMVADEEGWSVVPPGTRKSTYKNAGYLKAAPFAEVACDAIETADLKNPSMKKVPYTGIQFVGIPEFQSIGNVVGQSISDGLAGKMSIDKVLETSVAVATPNGYQKATIPIIVKDTTSMYWQIVLAGARKAGKDLNVNVPELGAQSPSDIDSQISILENAVATKPAAIVIAPTQFAALGKPIDEAAKKVIIIGIDSAADSKAFTSLLTTDNVQGGRIAGDGLAEAIKAKYGKAEGDVALITAIPGVGSLDERAKGFKEEIASKYPGLKLVADKVANGQATTGLNIMTDLIAANPNLRGVFASNLIMAQGAGQAIAENKVADKIKLVGFDSDDKLIKLLTDGTIVALVVQDPYRMGYDGIKIALAASKGEKVEAKIDTGANLITKENINSPRSRELLNPNIK